MFTHAPLKAIHVNGAYKYMRSLTAIMSDKAECRWACSPYCPHAEMQDHDISHFESIGTSPLAVDGCRGVEYPKLYAEGNNAVSKRFNCNQRVHQNTMENLPAFLFTQILLAQAYPVTASALGAVWATGEHSVSHTALLTTSGAACSVCGTSVAASVC